MPTDPSAPDAPVTMAALGAQLRSLRKTRELTLEQLETRLMTDQALRERVMVIARQVRFDAGLPQIALPGEARAFLRSDDASRVEGILFDLGRCQSYLRDIRFVLFLLLRLECFLPFFDGDFL